MKVSVQLKEDHITIKEMLRVLDAVCARLESGAEVHPDDLDWTVGFQRLFLLNCHMAKEEECLFPALTEAGLPREEGALQLIRAEHEIFRNHIRAMELAAAGCRSGDGRAVRELAGHAREYMNLLIDHTRNEDEVLYVLADLNLPETTQDELIVRFREIERRSLGAAGPGQFNERIRQLHAQYVG